MMKLKKILIEKMIEKKLKSNRQTYDPGNATKKAS